MLLFKSHLLFRIILVSLGLNHPYLHQKGACAKTADNANSDKNVSHDTVNVDSIKDRRNTVGVNSSRDDTNSHREMLFNTREHLFGQTDGSHRNEKSLDKEAKYHTDRRPINIDNLYTLTTNPTRKNKKVLSTSSVHLEGSNTLNTYNLREVNKSAKNLELFVSDSTIVPHGPKPTIPTNGRERRSVYTSEHKNIPPWFNDTLSVIANLNLFERIAKVQTLFCPTESFCYKAVSEFNETLACSPGWCFDCECKDCEGTRDCCVDKAVEGILDHDDYLQRSSCLSPTLKTSTTLSKLGYYLVNRCPKSFKDHENKTKCENPNIGPHNVLQFLPVFSNKTLTNYHNIFCAYCNNDTELLNMWQADVGCVDAVDLSDIFSTSAVLDLVFSNLDCRVDTRPPENAHSSQCQLSRKIINQCNETGMWETQDHDTSTACDLYRSPVFVGTTKQLYRNIFCAICNGLDLSVLVDAFNDQSYCSSRPPHDEGGAISFSMIFRITPNKIPEVRTNNTQQECGQEEVFDPYLRSCRKIRCSPGHTIENHTCVDALSHFEGIGNRVRYNYIPEDPPGPVSIKDVDSLSVWFINTFQNRERNYVPDYGFIFRRLSLHVCFRSDNGTETFTISRLEAQLEAMYGSLISQKDAEISLLGVLNSALDYWETLWRAEINNNNASPTCNNSTHKSYTFSSEAKGLPKSFLRKKNDPKSFPILTGLTRCTQLQLNESEFRIDPHTGNAEFTQTGEVIHKSEFLIAGRQIRICVNYSGWFSKETADSKLKYSSREDRVEILLTLICLPLSIFSLVVGLLIGIIVRQFRTTPGKIFLSLTTNLIIAQLLYLVSAYPLGWPCRILGLALHYFWLVVFAWKNIAAFHMCAVFTNPLKMAISSPTRLFMLYSLYGFIGPAVLILSYVIVKLWLSDMDSIGYGDSVCFLTTPLDIGLAFVLPVGLVLLTNTFLFARSLRSIWAMSEIGKCSNRANASHNALFIRMSIFLGFSWVFGFLANIVDELFMWYVFIVLNGTTGVFILGCQVCNGNIQSSLKHRLSGKSIAEDSEDSRKV